MFPKNATEFFESSIHLIYAVIAAQGFLVAAEIFIPPSNLLDYDTALSAVTITFVYFFLATAWFGFFKSTFEFHYLQKKVSIMRYGIALINSFVLYFMISLTAIEEKSADVITFRTDHGSIFVTLTIFSSLVVVAHCLKYLEYRDQKIDKKTPSKKYLSNTILKTLVVTGVYALQMILYIFVIPYIPYLKWDMFSAWEFVFIITSVAIASWYRWLMWDEFNKQNFSVKN